MKRDSSISTTSSQDSRTRSSTFSQFRSLSSSNSELDNQRLTALYCKISSESLETRRSNSQEPTDSSNTDDSVSVVSSKSTSVVFLEYKSQTDPSTAEMLRSHVRRSMTPDITTVHRRGRDHNDYLNSLLSPASSLDRVTADSIDRFRVRRNGSDKFNATIESVGQLSGSSTSLPQRSKSALGHYTRDLDDQWGGNPADRKSHTLSGSYSSKGLSNASPTRKSPVGAYPLHKGQTWSKSYSTDSTSRTSPFSDARTTPSLYVTDQFSYEPHARPNSALDVALSEGNTSTLCCSTYMYRLRNRV